MDNELFVYRNESVRKENFPIRGIVKEFNNTMGKFIISLSYGFCHMYMTEKATKVGIIHTVYYYNAINCHENVISKMEIA